MLSISNAYRYYFYIHRADMRKNFDVLSSIVQSQITHSPLSGDVFIFINKRCNQLNLLHWQGDGYAIYYKRLEKGTYELPQVTNTSSLVKLKAQDLLLIIEGISLLSVQKRKRYAHEINN